MTRIPCCPDCSNHSPNWLTMAKIVLLLVGYLVALIITMILTLAVTAVTL